MKIWDAESGELKKKLPGHENSIEGLAISADGTTIISSDRMTVKIWDANSGNLKHDLNITDVTAVAVSEDGKTGVLGSMTTLIILDVKSGETLYALNGHHRKIRGVDISVDGKIVVSGGRDHTVRVWNAESGRELHNLSENESYIIDVAISANGKTLVAGFENNTVKIWNANKMVLTRKANEVVDKIELNRDILDMIKDKLPTCRKELNRLQK